MMSLHPQLSYMLSEMKDFDCLQRFWTRKKQKCQTTKGNISWQSVGFLDVSSTCKRSQSRLLCFVCRCFWSPDCVVPAICSHFSLRHKGFRFIFPLNRRRWLISCFRPGAIWLAARGSINTCEQSVSPPTDWVVSMWIKTSTTSLKCMEYSKSVTLYLYVGTFQCKILIYFTTLNHLTVTVQNTINQLNDLVLVCN